MWKCIHRGLRTSANLLKNDQSNGGCVVSSVIGKDVNELPSRPNTLSSSTRVDDGILRVASKRKCTVDVNQDTGKDGLLAEPQIGNCVEVPNASFIAFNFQSKAARNGPDRFVHSEEAANSDLVCCRRCHKIYDKAPECLRLSKMHLQSWLSRKLHLHYPCGCSPSTSSTPGKFLNHSALRRPTYLELAEEKSLPKNSRISRENDSSLTTHDSSSAISYLQPYHSQKKRGSDLEKKLTLRERSQICLNFTSCLLKLPFLSYDFMRNKGLNQLYDCMQKKGKTEFSENGYKGQKRERSEESHEARKESWRRHQVQQSLLEAIGLSSALLLGWFLVHVRIWHPCGERRNAEYQQRGHGARCGMFSRLIFPRARSPHQPLHAVPSTSKEKDGKLVAEKQHPTKDDSANSVSSTSSDSGNDCTSENFSELFNLDDLQEKSFSSNFTSSLVNKEISKDAEENQMQDVHSVTVEKVKEKEPIPMPWYPQELKQFGPITLEQAIDEAGKSLEEAHAEVLLHLALEKLEEGEESDDESSAVDLLSKAAHLGSSVAAFNLGICYEMGVGGVTKDLSKAYYWYKVASDGEHAAAMYNMAIYHAQGLAGLSVDTKLARQLLEKASSFELPEARDALALLTTLKPTETTGLPGNDSVMADDHSISKSLSQFSLKDEESDASYSSDSDHLDYKKTGTSHNKISKRLDLPFSHIMTESLLTSLINEEDECSEIALDNTQSAKQSDLKYVSAIVLAH